MSDATSLVEISPAERRLAERVDPNVAGGLAVSDAAGGLSFRNAGEMMEFAKMMAVANSGVRKHLRGNPGACLAILTQALEWGMSPFAVANKSYFVNDQIAFESQLVQAVILRRAPIKGRIKFEFTGTGPKRVCRAWARLAEDPDEIVEYISPEVGLISPKNSPLWKSDQDQQHAYYSGRALCRRHFPDVLLGVYDNDEIQPEPRGPDGARDVTPRSFAAGLDRLANAGRDGAADVSEPKAEASPPEATATAEAGATPARRASAPPSMPAAKPAISDDAARQRGRDDATAGRERSEVPEDIQAAGMAGAWFAGHDEITEADVDASGPVDDGFDFPGDR